MKSEERYYRRRLQQESDAARRAVTIEALQRRQTLVAAYRRKLAELEAAQETFTLCDVA